MSARRGTWKVVVQPAEPLSDQRVLADILLQLDRVTKLHDEWLRYNEKKTKISVVEWRMVLRDTEKIEALLTVRHNGYVQVEYGKFFKLLYAEATHATKGKDRISFVKEPKTK